MTWLFVVLGIAVLAFVFMVVLGPLGELPPAEPDLKPDVVDGQPQFDVVVRGYRMDEVDQQLAAMQAELDALRDGRPTAAAVEVVEVVEVMDAVDVADRPHDA